MDSEKSVVWKKALVASIVAAVALSIAVVAVPAYGAQARHGFVAQYVYKMIDANAALFVDAGEYQEDAPTTFCASVVDTSYNVIAQAQNADRVYESGVRTATQTQDGYISGFVFNNGKTIEPQFVVWEKSEGTRYSGEAYSYYLSHRAIVEASNGKVLFGISRGTNDSLVLSAWSIETAQKLSEVSIGEGTYADIQCENVGDLYCLVVAIFNDGQTQANVVVKFDASTSTFTAYESLASLLGVSGTVNYIDLLGNMAYGEERTGSNNSVTKFVDWTTGNVISAYEGYSFVDTFSNGDTLFSKKTITGDKVSEQFIVFSRNGYKIRETGPIEHVGGYVRSVGKYFVLLADNTLYAYNFDGTLAKTITQSNDIRYLDELESGYIRVVSGTNEYSATEYDADFNEVSHAPSSAQVGIYNNVPLYYQAQYYQEDGAHLAVVDAQGQPVKIGDYAITGTNCRTYTRMDYPVSVKDMFYSVTGANGKYGVVDKDASQVVPCTYNDVFIDIPFNGGKQPMYIPVEGTGDTWYFYDVQKGEVVGGMNEEDYSFAAPTDLQWNTEADRNGSVRASMPAHITWRIGTTTAPYSSVDVYKENQSGQDRRMFGCMVGNSNEPVQEDYLPDDMLWNLDSGTYYFTVRLWDNGAQSPLAKSATWTYVQPSAVVENPPDAKLNDLVLSWTSNAGRDEVHGWQYEVYYSEHEITDDELPLITYYDQAVSPSVKDNKFALKWVGAAFVYADPIDDVKSADISKSLEYFRSHNVNETDDGYYYFRLRSVSADVTKKQNSDWSKLTKGVKVSAIKELLNSILQSDTGNTAQAVQDINTDDLKQAMEDDDVAKQIDDLDKKAQGQDNVTVEVDVNDNTDDFKDAGISGAALNPRKNGENKITLHIGEPGNKNHGRPDKYKDKKGYDFSMGLDGVANQEDLKVPVQIKLPIPAGYKTDNLVILHYVNNQTETIIPKIVTENGKTFAVFVLTRFSDFTLVSDEADTTSGGDTGGSTGGNTGGNTGGGSGAGTGGAGGGAAGGGSGATTPATETKNADGSTTTTTTAADGTVTKVTEGAADGSKTTEVIAKDGTSVTTIEAKDGTTASISKDATGNVTTASTTVSAEAATAAAKAHKPVELPLEAGIMEQAGVAVNTPAATGVQVPVTAAAAKPGAVVAKVAADGSITPVAKSKVSDGEATFIVDESGATYKVVNNATIFPDVSANDWFAANAADASAHGIMSGNKHLDGSVTFDGNMGTSRAMVAQILANIEHGQAGKPATFSDVKASDWYASAVAWASEKGIVQGYGDGTSFGPNDRVTREQLAVMMMRYANMLGMDTSARANISSYKDANKASYGTEAMQWAVAEGLISGYANTGELAPTAGATRAETSTILLRFINLML